MIGMSKTVSLPVVAMLALGFAGCGGDGDVAGPEDLAPSFPASHSLTTEPGEQYTVGVAVMVTLPAASGGNPPLAYSIAPTLPAGLAFDATARTLRGTPTTPQPRAEYAYTATDADGDAATIRFGITVVAAVGACRVGQVLGPGDACLVGSERFEVLADGRGRFGSITAGSGITINRFSAQRISGTDNWRIVSVP